MNKVSAREASNERELLKVVYMEEVNSIRHSMEIILVLMNIITSELFIVL